MRGRAIALAVGVLVGLAAIAPQAAAQRLGGSLERFVVQAPGGRPIAFHYAPGDSGAAAALAGAAGRFVPAPVTGTPLPPDTFDVVIAPSERGFAELTGGRVPDWGLAVAFPHLRRVVLRSPRLTGGMDVDPATVLRHELNHVYLAAAAGPGAAGIPLWFNEGFAALYAGEWRWVAPWRLAWGRITGALPPLADLRDRFPDDATSLAYTESLAAVRSLRERGGDRAVRALLERLRRGEGFDAALRETYGLTLEQFYASWQEELGHEYGWAVALSDQRAWWVLGAVILALAWLVRRRWLTREIAERKRREDEALGEPGDHSLGAEEWERYWEWEDDEWRGEEEGDA